METLIESIGYFGTLVVQVIFLNKVLSPFMKEKMESKENTLAKLWYFFLGFCWLISFVWTISKISSFFHSGCPLEYMVEGYC